MKNRALFNTIIISFALLLIIGSVMIIGNITNAFNKDDKNNVVCISKDGSVTLKRRNAGYEMKEEIVLSEGDEVLTYIDSSCVLGETDSYNITLGGSSTLQLKSNNQGVAAFEPSSGTTVFESKKNLAFTVTVGAATITPTENTLFSVEAFSGTQTLSVYTGSVSVSFLGETKEVGAGGCAILIQDEDGASSISYTTVKPDRLSDFLIGFLLEKGGCFTAETLNGIIEAREAETREAKQAQAAHEAEILAQGGTVAVINRTMVAGQKPVYDENIHTCTITIRCDTILNNMGNLSAGKNAYVPGNGVILSTSKVEFAEGESVYDVLKRACNYAGIPLEYSWTVEFGGYYIEGINNLYEFDCGKESGWMYKVNGWFPNYGCSNYTLKDGDVIVWCYTCNGLGKDVGCNWPE